MTEDQDREKRGRDEVGSAQVRVSVSSGTAFVVVVVVAAAGLLAVGSVVAAAAPAALVVTVLFVVRPIAAIIVELQFQRPPHAGEASPRPTSTPSSRLRVAQNPRPGFTVPYRTVPYRTVPYRTVPYRTIPLRSVTP